MVADVGGVTQTDMKVKERYIRLEVNNRSTSNRVCKSSLGVCSWSARLSSVTYASDLGKDLASKGLTKFADLLRF